MSRNWVLSSLPVSAVKKKKDEKIVMKFRVLAAIYLPVILRKMRPSDCASALLKRPANFGGNLNLFRDVLIIVPPSDSACCSVTYMAYYKNDGVK